MKKMITILFLLVSVHAFADPDANTQIRVLNCEDSSDPENYKSIEVFGAINVAEGSVSRIVTIVGVNFDVGLVKVMYHGGSGSNATGAVDPGSNMTYKDLIEAGTSLSVKDGAGTLKIKDQRIVFSNCQ